MMPGHAARRTGRPSCPCSRSPTDPTAPRGLLLGLLLSPLPIILSHQSLSPPMVPSRLPLRLARCLVVGSCLGA
jgi:hypothetical protein